jgi:hypothetical protein
MQDAACGLPRIHLLRTWVNSVCLWSQEGTRLEECGVKTEPQQWLAGRPEQDR